MKSTWIKRIRENQDSWPSNHAQRGQEWREKKSGKVRYRKALGMVQAEESKRTHGFSSAAAPVRGGLPDSGLHNLYYYSTTILCPIILLFLLIILWYLIFFFYPCYQNFVIKRINKSSLSQLFSKKEIRVHCQKSKLILM